jgi:hypothetical protein
VDDDLEPLVREPEQEVCLDQLQPFVRERGGVDGDLRAHAPRGMRQRVGAGHVRELLPRSASERPAGRREHDRVDLLQVARFETLEDGGVLAVDREQEASAPLPRFEREVARSYEAFLVGEREGDTALEGPERGREPCEADHGVQDDVRFG